MWKCIAQAAGARAKLTFLTFRNVLKIFEGARARARALARVKHEPDQICRHSKHSLSRLVEGYPLGTTKKNKHRPYTFGN